MRPPTLPRLFSLLTAIVFLNLVAGNTDARAQTFSDQQIQIIDHEDYYYDYLDNQNRSAFYFREGANAFALTTHSLGWLEFSGGVLRQNLVLYGGAEASITGGLIEINVVAYNNPTYWSGGTIGGTIFARGSAQFFIFGSQFTIDDLPVPYGPLTAITGTLGGGNRTGAAGPGDCFRLHRRGQRPDLRPHRIRDWRRHVQGSRRKHFRNH